MELYFHNYSDIEQFKTPLRITPKSIRIDYAYKGTVNFEGDKRNLYLAPFVLKVDKRSLDSENYHFVDGSFEGITILIKEGELDSELSQLVGNFQGWTDFNHSENYFFLKSSFIENLFNDLKSKSIKDSLLFLKLKVAELILYLKSSQALKDSIRPEKLSATDNIIIRNIAEYLNNNLNKQVSLHFLSIKFNVSQTKLKTLFKEKYGKTFHDYCTAQKMDYAAKLLVKSDMKIFQIANEVGYISSSKFSSAFKTKYFLAPRDFRKKLRLNS
ncbi:helix-turn-helix domain-containing protein [Liquorilactobacillus nagelii]|uniref:helix-turn-helix domain-containing protein n=1 Tax=Liquorilactobacillus nagelii TaxID=82688 RepID=UPI0039ECF967